MLASKMRPGLAGPRRVLAYASAPDGVLPAEAMLKPAGSVLIVDDQPEIRLLIRMTLDVTGAALREAADGQEALAACAAEAPDVVLLDVMLPDMSGYDICARLKADPRYARTRVILMTAGDQATERRRATEAGADLYVAKPFSPAEMLAHVSRYLGLRSG
jgi:CheY-like chemotaxis protein